MSAATAASTTRDRTATVTTRTPGDLLLHPLAIAAMAVVMVNDRVLKVRYPSELTGKLSDVAGLIFFPLLVVAVAEGIRWLVRRDRWTLTPRAVIAVSLAIGVAFVSMKTWHPAGELYRTVMGVVLWPVDAIAALIGGEGLPGLERIALVEDRTDLVALPALLAPGWIATRTRRRAEHADSGRGEGDDGGAAGEQLALEAQLEPGRRERHLVGEDAAPGTAGIDLPVG